MLRRGSVLFVVVMLPLLLLATLGGESAISSLSCVTTSSNSSFPIVTNGVATPIVVSSDDWEGVRIAVDNFASDIESVTGVRPEILQALNDSSVTSAIVVGTWNKSSALSAITEFNASSLEGQWEAFSAQVIDNPSNGLERVYVISGSDKRGTIFALYEHSEQFGVSPWYW